MDRDIGGIVDNWVAPPRPEGAVLEGRLARLERLDPDAHAAQLFAAFEGADAVWDYLPYGPFADLASYKAWLESLAAGTDPLFYVIRERESGLACGIASYLRIAPEAGSIEVGHIGLAPVLQRTAAATEALFLMMQWAFDAGYRRYEWKCNAQNRASRRAAERFGMSYEGIFRQAAVIKGRNRDTAWFAAIDAEWPVLRAAYETWLSPDNFDTGGHQKQRLSDLTRPVLVTRDPLFAG